MHSIAYRTLHRTVDVHSTKRMLVHRLWPTSCARRCNSSLTVTGESIAALDRWISSTLNRGLTLTDTLRGEHLSDLYVTLPTRDAAKLRQPYLCKTGQSLGYGHHLVFFHPRNPERVLRWDGTDADFCPPEPFSRRMWAGGKMKWNEPLSVGEKVIATSTIASVEKKGFEKGTPMVFVKQKLEYRRKHAQHAAIEEERSHVYLTAPGNRRGVRTVDGVPGDPDYRFEYLPSATTLFRFSALTFNGHFIHLDREYAATEGYPERLVHGPLTALMLLDVFSMQFPDSMISSFEYRAVNPLIVNRKVAICGKKHTSNNTVQVWAEDVETKAIGMVGQINLHNSA